MQRRTLIHGARQLVTLRGPARPRGGAELGQLHLIEDGALLIEDSAIVEVGPSRRLENLTAAKRATVISAAGSVVMPALIDAEAESLRVSLPPPEWGQAQPGACRPESRSPTTARLRTEAERILPRMLRHGTTAAGVKARTLKELRALQFLDSPVDVVPVLDVGPETLELLPAIHRRRLARIVQTRDMRCLEEALRLGFAARMEAPEHPAECCRAGMLGVAPAADLDPRDCAALAVSGVVAVLAPGVVFHRGGTKYPAARNMIDRGVAVALATGYGPLSNPSLSLAVTAALACRWMGMSAAEALAACTVNAAYALGTGKRAGSLEPGKQADIVMLGVPDYRAFAWEFGINLVSMVIKRGQIVYDAGKNS